MYIMEVSEEEREKGGRKYLKKQKQKLPKCDKTHEFTDPRNSTNSKQDKLRDPG
jgi:hypothetical protein